MARGTSTAPKRVGLILGREWSFPPAFIEEVAKRDAGVTVEFARIGATSMDRRCPYDVVIDRISHEVPFYRTWLKKALLDGVTVVNNPFMWSADDKFFGAALATKLGVASPKTMALPNKSYVPGIVPSESLRNLEYPLDWEGLVREIGMPCILKDAHGGGWKEVYVCRSLDELLHHYDRSGLLTMVVQEFIQWEQFVRCLCIGQEEILVMPYDPRERKYLVAPGYLTPELGARITEDARTLVRALGYDIYSLTPTYFEWTVRAMADMAIRLAKKPRRQSRSLKWDAAFTAGR